MKTNYNDPKINSYRVKALNKANTERLASFYHEDAINHQVVTNLLHRRKILKKLD